MGDNKDQVKETAKITLNNLIDSYLPSFIWDRLSASFNHKLAKVRDELLDILKDTLIKYLHRSKPISRNSNFKITFILRFGTKDLQLNKLITYLVKLLNDQSIQIRDHSILLLIEIYKYTGDKLRIELKKKQVPEQK